MMKILDLIFYFVLLLFFIFVLVIELSPMITTDAAASLTILIEIIFMFLLIWNLVILIARLVDLMMDASSTYGEQAMMIPPQKTKINDLPSKLLII